MSEERGTCKSPWLAYSFIAARLLTNHRTEFILCCLALFCKSFLIQHGPCCILC